MAYLGTEYRVQLFREGQPVHEFRHVTADDDNETAARQLAARAAFEYPGAWDQAGVSVRQVDDQGKLTDWTPAQMTKRGSGLQGLGDKVGEQRPGEEPMIRPDNG